MSDIITGTLDDYDLMTEGEHKGRYAIRLDGKPFPVMPHVDAFLTKRRKGEYVDVTVTEKGWVSKITPSAKKPAQEPAQKGVTDIAGDAVEKAKAAEAERLKKAGFGTPITAPAYGDDKKQECTSPVTPPVQPMIIKGEITTINAEKRAIAVRDSDNVVTPLFYTEVLDDLIRKQKVGWYVEATFRMEEDRAILKNLRYADRPAGMKKGGRQFVPRNEKPMLYESVFKSLCEVFDPEKDGKGKSFEDNARRIWSMTIEIAGDMAGISGVN